MNSVYRYSARFAFSGRTAPFGVQCEKSFCRNKNRIHHCQGSLPNLLRYGTLKILYCNGNLPCVQNCNFQILLWIVFLCFLIKSFISVLRSRSPRRIYQTYLHENRKNFATIHCFKLSIYTNTFQDISPLSRLLPAKALHDWHVSFLNAPQSNN